MLFLIMSSETVFTYFLIRYSEVIASLEVNDVTNADVFFFFFGILLVQRIVVNFFNFANIVNFKHKLATLEIPNRSVLP